MGNRIIIIANPTAGQGLGPAKRMASILTRAGAAVEIASTAARGDATRIARDAAVGGTADIVVAAGGDGTAGEVMAGLIGSSLPLAVLPAGTANVAALTLGLPAEADGLAHYILNAPALPFQPALANGHPFLCVASAGFDAEAVRRVSIGLKQRAGKLAYVWAGLSTFAAHAAPLMQVHVNGRHYDAAQVIITRGPFYAGRYRLFPEGEAFTGSLNVMLVQGRNRLELARFALAAALGRHLSLSGVRHFQTDMLTITSEGTAAVEVDGDDLCDAPVTFRLADVSVLLKRPALS